MELKERTCPASICHGGSNLGQNGRRSWKLLTWFFCIMSVTVHVKPRSWVGQDSAALHESSSSSGHLILKIVMQLPTK